MEANREKNVVFGNLETTLFYSSKINQKLLENMD